MKVLGLIGVLVLATACNNAAPTATGYKQQLGAPAAVTGTNSGNATAGDPAKGQTALAGCTGCHTDAGTPAHKLAAADAASIESGTAAGNAGHPAAIGDAIRRDGKDIAAFLKGGSTTGTGTPAAATGDAAAGQALLTAQCEGCHVPDGTGTGPALDEFSTLAGQEGNQIHASVQQNFTDPKKKADIEAALKAKAQ